MNESLDMMIIVYELGINLHTAIKNRNVDEMHEANRVSWIPLLTNNAESCR